MRKVPVRGKYRRAGVDPGKHQQIPPSRAAANRRYQEKGSLTMRSRIVRTLVAVFVAAMFANLFVTDSVSVAKAAPMVSAGRCDQLIPRGPWAVVQGAGPQEIELGFAGYGHWDLYAAPGLRTVSYITEPGGRFGVYHGYGSAWEQVANCDWSTYPWLTDAQNYQVNRGRTRSAGLVINVNQRPEGNLMVVHLNPFGLSESEVCQVLREQGAAWSFDNGGAPVWVLSEIGMDAGHCNGAPVVSVPIQPVIQQAPPPVSGAACNPAVRWADLQSSPNNPVLIQSGDKWLIVNGWSNWTNPNVGDHTFVVPPGESILYKGGGSVWERPNGCQAATYEEFNSSRLAKYTLSQMRSMGFDARTSSGNPGPLLPSTYVPGMTAVPASNVVSFQAYKDRKQQLAAA